MAKGGYSQAYLFDHAPSLVLVDTGWDTDAHEILKYLWSIGRTPDELTDIAITHGHRSHLGGMATLKRLSGAQVHAHAWEAGILNGGRPAQPRPRWPLLPVALFLFPVGPALLVPHAFPRR